MTLGRVLVVGGNGFMGSHVCKVALAKGFQVTSISSSGHPYRSPKGHSPAWTAQVDWQKGDALQPATYSHLLPNVSGVVHTIGTLFEDGKYKEAIRKGDLLGILSAFVGAGMSNPLSDHGGKGSYEVLNRDTALRVCEAFLEAKRSSQIQSDKPRPFIYISAEDLMRPLIPAGYIEMKREAESRIRGLMKDQPDYRPVFIRPGLVYHAHLRPMISPAAALIDLSATLHSKVPQIVPTPSSMLRSLGRAFRPTDRTRIVNTSPLESMADALITPPIHVEHVAEAACVALDPSRSDVRGAYGVAEMRDLIGWSERESDGSRLAHEG